MAAWKASRIFFFTKNTYIFNGARCSVQKISRTNFLLFHFPVKEILCKRYWISCNPSQRVAMDTLNRIRGNLKSQDF